MFKDIGNFYMVFAKIVEGNVIRISLAVCWGIAADFVRQNIRKHFTTNRNWLSAEDQCSVGSK